MKRCSKCKLRKLKKCFYKDRSEKSGLKSWCNTCDSISRKLWKSNNKEHCKNYELLYRYGISLADYNKLFQKQKGKCAICGNPPKGLYLIIDHISYTKIVRGLLCHSCNVGIGLLQHSISNLRAAVKYLKTFAGRTGI